MRLDSSRPSASIVGVMVWQRQDFRRHMSCDFLDRTIRIDHQGVGQRFEHLQIGEALPVRFDRRNLPLPLLHGFGGSVEENPNIRLGRALHQPESELHGANWQPIAHRIHEQVGKIPIEDHQSGAAQRRT